jgi:hypothetical protein
MCVAIPTPIGELSTLASKTEGSLKGFMNHFVELISAQRCSRNLPTTTILNSSAREMGSVGRTADENGDNFSK